MKQCIHCGAELPDEALFCPHCETPQNEAAEAKTPKIWRKRTAIVLAVALMVAAAAVIYRLTLGPRTYDAQGPELTYKGYHVLLSFSNGQEPRPADEMREHAIGSHLESAFPSQLCIYRNNDTVNAKDEFMEKVERVELETAPRDGASQMTWTDPVYTEAKPEAALMSNIGYNSDCGTNDIIWTVTMKNGDKLILRQYIVTHLLPEAFYYSDDYDMTTIESLQALLDEIETTVDPETHVSIYLPAVVYEGGLTLSARSYYLYGASDGTITTTFRGGLTLETESPVGSELHNIRFEGNGGTGLFATKSALVEDCVFSGWDVGALASEGAWLSTFDCTFERNGIGLQFNSSTARARSGELGGNIFASNGIGFHAVVMPEDVANLALTDCVFRDNDVDLQNDTDAELDTSGATFQ